MHTLQTGYILHHNIDNKTYLILSITPSTITLQHIKDGVFKIPNKPQTLQKFTLIK